MNIQNGNINTQAQSLTSGKKKKPLITFIKCLSQAYILEII